ncbi:trypsin-like peptidase domain-containing protein [Flavobacterium sp. W21_SRS_FM6]|uniref:trypsin-like peptidase domain-containing protein n=1 Tax=Flavobacterium sp. W21_SRS_FM6 TaxID=3240268 RepID=UPI003F92DBF0
MLKTISFIFKSILIGVVVSSIILLLVPDLRKGSDISWALFSKQTVTQEKLSFNHAVNAAGPAVVNIYSIDSTVSFNRRQPVERISIGSGVIMTESGYILTCQHVIENANSILVGLQDGRRVEAQIIGKDPITDLAVLRINADNLHVIPQQDNPDMRVGDVVLAIGNPYDLGQTITQGIVSRFSQSLLANYFDYIQTDAVLNEGNSGGALVDSNGYLVGINNANYKTLDSRRRVKEVEGVSFAIPYDLAKKVMDEMITNGKVTRGVLGFGGQENPLGDGILVTSVTPSSPAEVSGLHVGDIVVSVDTLAANDLRKTLDFISNTLPGKTMELKVNRNKTLLTIPIVVAELK